MDFGVNHIVRGITKYVKIGQPKVGWLLEAMAGWLVGKLARWLVE